MDFGRFSINSDLWVTSGTPGTTVRLNVPESMYARECTTVGNTIYFTADSPADGKEHAFRCRKNRNDQKTKSVADLIVEQLKDTSYPESR